jgi:hypothetical protein
MFHGFVPFHIYNKFLKKFPLQCVGYPSSSYISDRTVVRDYFTCDIHTSNICYTNVKLPLEEHNVLQTEGDGSFLTYSLVFQKVSEVSITS